MVMSGSNRRGARLAAVLASTTLVGVGASVPASADGGHNNLSASLTGAKERPGPGDPDGRGMAQIKMKKTEICFELSWRNIDAPVAAHIHEGNKDIAGDVVVTLLDAPEGVGAAVSTEVGCTDADPALIKDIRQEPRNYYVNIHNAMFPEGAIRGQLHRGGARGGSPTGAVDAGGGGTANTVADPATLSTTSAALPAAGLLVGGLVLLGAAALVLRGGRTRTGTS